MIFLPRGWEAAMARVAGLFDHWGPASLWWCLAVALLVTAGLVASRRPRIAIGLAAAASMAFGVATNGLIDDAYIQFRYADNLANGLGFVFNAGERLEGASGGVWIAILALAKALFGTDPGIAARVLSLGLAGAATILAGVAGSTLAGPGSGAVGAMLWAPLPTLAIYAGSGLETTAYAAALWLLVVGIVGQRTVWAATGGVLTALLRPEAILLGAAALVFVPRLTTPARRGVFWLLGAAAAAALMRLAYFGSPVPRSALVKGFSGAPGAGQGLSYLGSAILELLLILILATVAVARRRQPWVPALVPVAAWVVLVAVRGGDWMPGGRYLLPLAVVATAAAVCFPAGRVRACLVGLSIAWGCLLLAPVGADSYGAVGKSWREARAHLVRCNWWEALGRFLAGSFPKETTIAVGPAGAVPYASGLATIDLYGLCSPVARTRSGWPGHTLWGLPEVAGRTDVVYPGRPLPQIQDVESIVRAAEAHVADVPNFAMQYRPIVLLHAAERPLDVVADVVWVRPVLAARLLSAAPVHR